MNNDFFFFQKSLLAYRVIQLRGPRARPEKKTWLQKRQPILSSLVLSDTKFGDGVGTLLNREGWGSLPSRLNPVFELGCCISLLYFLFLSGRFISKGRLGYWCLLSFTSGFLFFVLSITLAFAYKEGVLQCPRTNTTNVFAWQHI